MNKTILKLKLPLSISVLCLALTACGGGSSDTPPEKKPIPFTSELIEDQTFYTAEQCKGEITYKASIHFSADGQAIITTILGDGDNDGSLPYKIENGQLILDGSSHKISSQTDTTLVILEEDGTTTTFYTTEAALISDNKLQSSCPEQEVVVPPPVDITSFIQDQPFYEFDHSLIVPTNIDADGNPIAGDSEDIYKYRETSLVGDTVTTKKYKWNKDQKLWKLYNSQGMDTNLFLSSSGWSQATSQTMTSDSAKQELTSNLLVGNETVAQTAIQFGEVQNFSDSLPSFFQNMKLPTGGKAYGQVSHRNVINSYYLHCESLNPIENCDYSSGATSLESIFEEDIPLYSGYHNHHYQIKLNEDKTVQLSRVTYNDSGDSVEMIESDSKWNKQTIKGQELLILSGSHPALKEDNSYPMFTYIPNIGLVRGAYAPMGESFPASEVELKYGAMFNNIAGSYFKEQWTTHLEAQ